MPFENGTVTLWADTSDGSSPTPEQIDFVEHTCANIDAYVGKALLLITSEFEQWTKKDFPNDWRHALQFTGLEIPENGDDLKPWVVSFDCIHDTAGDTLDCTFENGLPKKAIVNR